MVAMVIVMLLAIGSTAEASGKKHGHGWGHMYDGWGDRWEWGLYNTTIPQNIRDKMTESEKLSIDIRNIMTTETIDRAKALETFRKQRALKDEISEWFFTQRIDWLIANPGVRLIPKRY